MCCIMMRVRCGLCRCILMIVRIARRGRGLLHLRAFVGIMIICKCCHKGGGRNG
jgi:hypothetical protein